MNRFTLINRILAVLFGAVAIGTMVLLVSILSNSRVLVYKSSAIFFSIMFTGVFIYFSALTIGMAMQRKWSVYLYNLFFIVMSPPLLLISLYSLKPLWHTKDLVALFVVLLVIGVFVFIKFYLRNNKELFIASSEKIDKSIKTGLIVIGALIGMPILSFTIFTGIMVFGDIFSSERTLVNKIENNKYIVEAFHYPGKGVFSDDFLNVVSIDKDSWLKGEKRVWSKDYANNISLAFTNDSTLMIAYNSERDTLIVDLEHIPDILDKPEDYPKYHYELNYEGCVDKTIAENENYKIIFRKYPSKPGKYAGAVRILAVDKDSWFKTERSLIKGWENDTASVKFLHDNTLSLDLYKVDSYNRQTGTYGQVKHLNVDLDDFDGIEYTY